MADDELDVDLEKTKLKVHLEGYADDFVDSLTYENLEDTWDYKTNSYDTGMLLGFFVEFLQERMKKLCP